MIDQTTSSPSEISLSGTTLVGTPEPYLEEPTETDHPLPGTSRNERVQHMEEPTETKTESAHVVPAPSTPRNIPMPREDGPYGILNRTDLVIDDRCARCGDVFPCLTLSCNWRYEYNVPPTPKKQTPGEPGWLRRELSDRYRAEWERIKDEEPFRRRRASLKRMAGIRETRDACRELRLWRRRMVSREERQARLNRLSGATAYDLGEGPASMAFANSATVECLHCRTTCSATQVDCPICGGKVQGQCTHRRCNDGTGAAHDPA